MTRETQMPGGMVILTTVFVDRHARILTLAAAYHEQSPGYRDSRTLWFSASYDLRFMNRQRGIQRSDDNNTDFEDQKIQTLRQSWRSHNRSRGHGNKDSDENGLSKTITG